MSMKADLPVGPFALAVKFKVPASFTFVMKTGRTKYSFYATQAKVYDSEADYGRLCFSFGKCDQKISSAMVQLSFFLEGTKMKVLLISANTCTSHIRSILLH
jgi:hypothetical protein